MPIRGEWGIMEIMTVEEFCYKIYKHTFAHVLHSGIYAAHVIIWMKKNPFTYEHDYLVQKILDNIVGGVRFFGRNID